VGVGLGDGVAVFVAVAEAAGPVGAARTKCRGMPNARTVSDVGVGVDVPIAALLCEAEVVVPARDDAEPVAEADGEATAS